MPSFEAFFVKQHVFVKLSRTLPSSFTGTVWGNKVRTCQIIAMQRPAPEGTFARTIPYRLHVEWLNGYVILMCFLCDSYVIHIYSYVILM